MGIDTPTRRVAFQDEAAISPRTLGIRTASLPLDNQAMSTAGRPSRGLMDAENAPKLPRAKPLSYDELYPNPPEPVAPKLPPPRMPRNS